MDAEKNSALCFKHSAGVSKPSAFVTVLRGVQYVVSILALVFVSCAIDRNILVPGVTSEEKILAVSSVAACVVILCHFVGPYRARVVVITDGLLATFLFASFVYGAYSAGQDRGACSGPSKIGVWDNTRGCTRMIVAAAFTAINCAAFLASSVLTAFL
ncbi:uncharacterized protein AB675_4419 [Cyphellophora attinorum]|uniref:MARVEL domain-containing protein n=1 Tax=Cyphellophora attinorum TaxID=1664694 RepID=A0A0N1NYS1_9EURO|nr:uncharacterized protein AB675_4419 [Phialophora attinorum]KPI36502.1 hypothetical protein AB675_4419 [Phialophora attinorum]